MGTHSSPSLSWRKSSFSGGNGNCVELAALADGRIAVRNSNHPDWGVVQASRGQMAAFLAGVKAREFDGFGS